MVALSGVGALGQPVGSGARTFTVGNAEIPVFQQMSYEGLSVAAFPWERAPEESKRNNCFLRVMEDDSYHYVNRTYRLGRGRTTVEPLPEEFLGLPGFICQLEKYTAQGLTLKFSKPVRVYAYIRWWWSTHPNAEMPLWQLYERDHRAFAPIYYRDFDAGTHVMNFLADHVIGLAISPRDAFRPKEKIIAVPRIVDGKPVLHVSSEHAEEKTLEWSYEIANPGSGLRALAVSSRITCKPGKDQILPIDASHVNDGTLYYIENTLKLEGTTWRRTLPYGRFSVPPRDASVEAPLFPYGGYVHLAVNEDPEIYNLFLAATFHHFRKMRMNVAVLKQARQDRLDLAAKYGLKAIIRLGNTAGTAVDTPEDVVRHPAVLTYMIGDEPKVGPKLDAHIRLYREVVPKYPEYEPVTCTIYDGYGSGDESDPVLIHHLLRDFRFTRFGRYYCFRKDRYGLLWPAGYKGMLPAPAVFSGLEANKLKSWWLAPPYFGKAPRLFSPVPYWRIPTGPELQALCHLALAHRCGAIIGWGSHSHGTYASVLFDGQSMAETEHSAVKEMTELGDQIVKAKNVLLNFTPARLQLFWREPQEVDAAARWLKNGMFAVYVVNLDVDNSHPVVLTLYLGSVDVPKFRGYPGDKWFGHIESVTDVLTGRKAAFEKEERAVEVRLGPGTRANANVYVKIKLDKLGPGRAALLVAKAKTDNGAFPNAPDDIRASVEDALDVEVDF